LFSLPTTTQRAATETSRENCFITRCLTIVVLVAVPISSRGYPEKAQYTGVYLLWLNDHLNKPLCLENTV